MGLNGKWKNATVLNQKPQKRQGPEGQPYSEGVEGVTRMPRNEGKIIVCNRWENDPYTQKGGGQRMGF